MARKCSPHPTTVSVTAPMVRDATGDDFILPKDPFESAQELALSLRVEVETLRLAEAMEGQEGGKSWAVREVQEEVSAHCFETSLFSTRFWELIVHQVDFDTKRLNVLDRLTCSSVVVGDARGSE